MESSEMTLNGYQPDCSSDPRILCSVLFCPLRHSHLRSCFCPLTLVHCLCTVWVNWLFGADKVFKVTQIIYMILPSNSRHCWCITIKQPPLLPKIYLMWLRHKEMRWSQMRSCFKFLFAIYLVSFTDFPIPDVAMAYGQKPWNTLQTTMERNHTCCQHTDALTNDYSVSRHCTTRYS